jgi:hypothetical protein
MQCVLIIWWQFLLSKVIEQKPAKKKLTGFPVSYTNYHNNLAIG